MNERKEGEKKHRLKHITINCEFLRFASGGKRDTEFEKNKQTPSGDQIHHMKSYRFSVHVGRG